MIWVIAYSHYHTRTVQLPAGAFVVRADDEPRILDIDLAERLGFANPDDIRQLIVRNMSELEAFGFLPRREVKNGKRGRPSKAYWLNEEQALDVASLSRTPKAAAVRSMLIRCFTAWRRSGPISP